MEAKGGARDGFIETNSPDYGLDVCRRKECSQEQIVCVGGWARECHNSIIASYEDVPTITTDRRVASLYLRISAG